MKTFKQYISELAPAANEPDGKFRKSHPDDAEQSQMIPRSPGEREFADMHLVIKTDHPVATPQQFSGNAQEPVNHTASRTVNPGEDKIIKQGSSKTEDVGKKMTQTAPRRGDRREGDLRIINPLKKIAESVKGLFELDDGKTIVIEPKNAALILKTANEMSEINRNEYFTRMSSNRKNFDHLLQWSSV